MHWIGDVLLWIGRIYLLTCVLYYAKIAFRRSTTHIAAYLGVLSFFLLWNILSGFQLTGQVTLARLLPVWASPVFVTMLLIALHRIDLENERLHHRVRRLEARNVGS